MTQEERIQKINWLNRALRAEQNVQALREKAERDSSSAERISRGMSGGSSGSFGNTTENCIIRLAETKEQLRAARRELAAIRREISDAIGQLADPTLRELMEHRYLSYEKFSDIAAKMHYDDRTIRRKHNRALEKICP